MKIESNGKQYLILKSSVLWMMDNKSNKVSTDRLRRFMAENVKSRTIGEHLVLGDFVEMLHEGSVKLCQVVGFRYQKRKRRYTALSCPTKISADNAEGIDVLVNFYDVTDKKITSSNRQFRYIDIVKYKNHITIKRDAMSNELITE